MKKLLFLVAILALIWAIPAHADLSSTDQYELNNATPGTSKILSGKGLGYMLAGSRLSQAYGAGLGNVASSLGNVDSNSPNTTITPYRVVIWNVPVNNYSINLGPGITGQLMTIIKGNTGTTAGKISPQTKTGFTDATLTNQGDGVTFQWHDGSGWIPDGTFGTSTNTGKVNP